ncbi:MAG: T9SS type A sorting domain-containing protein [Ignavibacteria bacterium]|nr:T9SS type A sorting domain-containing protein [Ignavibacteria bacterium]
MKKLLQFILFFFLCLSININSAISQYVYTWYELPSGTNANLNKFYQGYIVGDNGILLYVSGLNIYNYVSGSNANLNDMIDGFIIGSNGTILKSTNYNSNWYLVNSGTTENLYSIARTIPYRHFVVGSNGKVISSTNMGEDWFDIQSPTSVKLKSIYFCTYNTYPPIPNNGWIVGDNGTLLKTTNMGNNWFLVNTNTNVNLNCVTFTDTLNGWIAGDNGTLKRTFDGGYSWANIPLNTNANLNEIRLQSSYSNGGQIVGSAGTVFYTTNGGNSWLRDSTLGNITLNSAYYTFPLYVAGNDGKIFVKMIDSLYLPNYKFQANNITTWIGNSGIYNHYRYIYGGGYMPGFEWPSGSNKHAVYTSGFNIAAFSNGSLRMAAASYSGEYRPGFSVYNGFLWDNRFKIYRVTRGDNSLTNPDYARWGDMVPFGAPYVDNNNNGIYEPGIDIPGVKNAKQTIFVHISDSDPASHSTGEGFGGGTLPLHADVQFTSWAYDKPGLMDVQFMKWKVINKYSHPWNGVHFTIYGDADLGDAWDDFSGCDTNRNLAFCYNRNNNDPIYGINPPAVGFDILKSANDLKLTSFSNLKKWSGGGGPTCELEVIGDPVGAYNFMRGYKKDLTPWVIPNTNPPQITKFCYSGDPETATGWTEQVGSVYNCGGLLTGQIISPNYFHDRWLIINSGSDSLIMNPNDTQTVIVAQMIAQGSSNLNSVTKLKELSDSIQVFYENGYPIGIEQQNTYTPLAFVLYQNYPNPFNPTTNIKFDIKKLSYTKLIVYDILGKEIATLVNEKLSAGSYEVSLDGRSYPSGVYFYRLVADDFVDVKKMIFLK